jgi:hypothetical protein
VEIKQRLRFDYCYLIRVRVERMNMELAFAGFKIYVTERLKSADGLIRKFHEHAAIACEPFKVGMALPVEIRTHLFDLEISHVAHAPAEGALVAPLASELESFDKASLRQGLVGRVDQFCQAHILREDACDVRTVGDPDNGLILFRLDLTARVNGEKLRMQRSLIKGED